MECGNSEPGKLRMTQALNGWADFVFRRAWTVFFVGILVFCASLFTLRNLSLSTNINALMPDGARSVQTLENALEMIGNYASIQVVIEADSPERVIEVAEDLSPGFEKMSWTESAQYYEDVEVLVKHELLFLSENELLDLEQDAYKSMAVFFAREMSGAFETEVTFTLGDPGVTGSSLEELDPVRVEQFEEMFATPPSERRYFTSGEGKTMILVAAPKPGLEDLSDAKVMVQESEALIQAYMANNPDVSIGVTGRIAGQVGQFDALIRDLKIGLGSAFLIIGILLLAVYRTPMAVPLIIVPLVISLLATLAVTTLVIGQLNLITAFLTLILFGLGIDFGVHNFSRYVEERRSGTDLQGTIRIIIERTGRASFMAAITTGASFFALMLTQFRAFSEFGFIAGSGMLLAFLSMYSIFPAMVVIAERAGWTPKKKTREPKSRKKGRSLFAERHPVFVVLTAIAVMAVAVYAAPKIQFETNTKNLEATLPERFETAKIAARKVLGNPSWAVMVADTYEDLIGIDKHFVEERAADGENSTILQVRSLLSFVPPPEVQQKRLNIIRRLKEQADRLSGLDPEKYKTGQKYLDIESLSIAALPPILKKTYIGQSQTPGYLYYIDPNVRMSDSSEASRFYADAGQVTVGDKTFYSASESFVLVEMLGLMQSDALKAVLLVTLTTIFIVWLFFRNAVASIVVLIPPLCGVFLTLGFMGLFGPRLSIMNMVILPSLVGISVDNGIHIVHRFLGHGPQGDLGYIMLTTGRAALLTTVTTLIGFGGMITASIGGLQSLALLAIIGFSLCLAMTWFLLPAILTILAASDEDVGNIHTG